jgi:hypothetical protein
MITLDALAKDRVEAEWNSLMLSMEEWDNYPGELKPQHIPDLVTEARSFAYLFKNYFEDTLPNANLQEDGTDQWTVLHQAREVLLAEWDTIRQMLEQRVDKRYQSKLVELDQLTKESLEGVLPEQAQNALTYLHKTYNVTRFAFSKTPIVGAPFSALHLPESWLSIPHEAGHFIFWNMTTTMGDFARFYAELEKSVIDALATTLGKRQGEGHFRRTGEIYRTWLLWLNEIFADIYGTLVAGPASGWSMQIMLRSQLNRRDLYHVHDDPDHPDPYIRPFIHIATLRYMAELTPDKTFQGELLQEANALEDGWRRGWNGEDPANSLFTPDNWGSMDELLKEDLPAVVRAIMQVDLGNGMTLAQSFMKDIFYTAERHQEVMGIVETLNSNEGTVDVQSKLTVCVAAQLAIVRGADPVAVRQKLNFGTQPQIFKIDDSRLNQFEVFQENVIGQAQSAQAWRRVLKSTASEVVYNGWHHGHAHSH